MKTTPTLALLFLAGCQVAPSAADVAADRDRWAAVTAVTADRAVDDAEAPLLSELLAAWDASIQAAEARVAAAGTTWQDLVRVYGSATVNVLLAQEIATKAPELFRFVDRNEDGELSPEELMAVDPANPVFAAAVVSTAVRLLARKP